MQQYSVKFNVSHHPAGTVLLAARAKRYAPEYEPIACPKPSHWVVGRATGVSPLAHQSKEVQADGKDTLLLQSSMYLPRVASATRPRTAKMMDGRIARNGMTGHFGYPCGVGRLGVEGRASAWPATSWINGTRQGVSSIGLLDIAEQSLMLVFHAHLGEKIS